MEISVAHTNPLENSKSPPQPLTSSLHHSTAIEFDISCPYRPFNSLFLRQGERELHTVIKQVYRGGGQTQFSNSCTVLLSVREALPNIPTQGQVIPKEIVLKIFDWRYSTAFRDTYDSDEWNTSHLGALVSVSTERRKAFWQWLSQITTVSERENPLLKNLIHIGRLPIAPSHMDVYGYIMTKSHRAQEFMNNGLIPELPSTGIREIYLQRCCLLHLAAEQKVARIVNERFPGRMPTPLGVWEVHPGGFSSPSTQGRKAHCSIVGLAMEEHQGEPFSSISRELPDGGQLLDILYDLALFQLQLLRCNLQITDPNIHNFFHSSNDKYGHLVTMVDFGAISIIKANPDSDLNIRAEIYGENSSEQLLSDHYMTSFDMSSDRVCIFGLVRQCRSDIEANAEDTLLQYADPDIEKPMDRLLWRTILLHFIHSFNPDYLSQHGAQALHEVYVAQDIMRVEALNASNVHWSIRAVHRICQVMHKDMYHGLKRLRTLQTIFDRWQSHPPASGFSSTELPLRTLRYNKNDCEEQAQVQSCLIFGGSFNELPKS